MNKKKELDSQIHELIAKFYSLPNRDFNLIEEIMDLLKIPDLGELRLSLENIIKVERDAAMRQIEKRLTGLLSEDTKIFEETKSELKEFFHSLQTSDEEAFI